MKLLNLKLRGAIGVKKGLGLNEIELDLSDLSGLVVLDGANGRGKSTVLDNLQPYRMLPSRKRSLQHHFFLRDSFRDLSLEYDGHLYRFLVKIDPERNKQEAFIYVDGGESITTGKVKEYDAEVRRMFGSLDLFLASVFCAQKTDDSQLTTGQLKEQFVEFLRLHELQRHHETAKQCARIFTAEANHLSQHIERLSKEAAGMDEAMRHQEFVFAELDKAQQELERHKKALADLDAQYAEALKAASKSEANKERIKYLQGQIDNLRNEIADLEGDLAARVKNIDIDIAAALDEQAEKTKQASQIVLVERAAIEKSALGEHLAEAKKEIEDQRAKWDELNKAQEALRAEFEKTMKSYRNALDANTGAEMTITGEINRLKSQKSEELQRLKLVESDRKITSLKLEISTCEQKLKDLDRRDPDCVSTTCSYIVGALTAKSELPQLREALKQREAELEQTRIEIQNQIKTIEDSLADKQHELQSILTKRNSLQAEIRQSEESHNAKLHKIQQQLETIEGRGKKLKTKIDSIEQNIARCDQLIAKQAEIKAADMRVKDLAKQVDRLQEEKKQLKTKTGQAIETKQNAMAELKRTMAELEPDDDADARVKEIESMQQATADLISKKQREIEVLRQKLVAAEHKVKMLSSIELELDTCKKQRDRLVSEASEWSYLSDACSKNGLQALEIDAVAPVISDIANGLLSSTFGPTFQVRIDTLNDDNRETLDIWVIREDGTEVLLDDLSGGEKVWVLKALRLARTMIAKEKSNKNILTCFADEEDGALRHGETSENYIRLYRQFLAAAGFESCIYISHKPECIAMADHRIVFNGGVHVE